MLCATSGVRNTGIDSNEIRAVYRVDFPPSVTDVSQERRRAGRRDDASPRIMFIMMSLSQLTHFYIFTSALVIPKHDREMQVIIVIPSYRRN